jgi:DNA-binding response OmpR family regulator
MGGTACEGREEGAIGILKRMQAMAELQARILVVDDEVRNVKLMEAILAPRGYTVVQAYNGEEALQQVQRQRPDLILLDVMMPGMNGFEVCRRLKDNADTCLIPVVIMTALGRTEDRIQGIDAGADDFLTKPVNRDELLARIRTSLRLKRAIDHKVSLLQNIQEHLVKFVPQSVTRLIAAHPEAPELEKKEQDVSVLFVDISGYTRWSELLPHEDMNLIIESYFSSFLDCIHTNGGDINETAGDGLMVIFADADPAHHARKAVQAALEIVQRAAPLDEQLQETFGSISVHIGINSGLALVGTTKLEGATGTRWTYTASGPMTNIAARIATLGEGGMILVGSETARRVEGCFLMQEIGLRQFKNISEEVLVYRILGEVDRQV